MPEEVVTRSNTASPTITDTNFTTNTEPSSSSAATLASTPTTSAASEINGIMPQIEATWPVV
ncbi:hypothetical protein EYR41_000513 [Orbilia oligospora]|uniref:Uncharacterized protein n=1 Tax=Orbilia oligospora TaxID=2813651 RepID=A0A7C8P490_ORBOL|nr:hypothetical protein TWF751_011169 [Orbilia oligospora]KAF3252735.1 hypothetical protein TWF128_006640 [Orbilia oligospora]KAF3252842.1 hypothetical protein TWF217_007590 [Orbilia oligospora]KAF3293195.1 hypothetical protein TWF132_004850 [Orbilia oligospora]TGJ73416.1 hypothetical protein EYR41_000513 [Orbilia oligospora]